MTAISVARKCGMIGVNENVALLSVECDSENSGSPKIFIESLSDPMHNQEEQVINFDDSVSKSLNCKGKAHNKLYMHVRPAKPQVK